MDTEIADHDSEGLGVRVYDEYDIEHQIALDWDGKVTYHGVNEYPQQPADRTDEEQLLMSQVEVRARFAANEHFDAQILDPDWDPAYFKRARTALMKYPDERFHAEFRDFYDAVQAPEEFVDDPRHEPGGEAIYKSFGITEGDEIGTVDDLLIQYNTGASASEVGSLQTDEEYDRVVCALPRTEFTEDTTFEGDFRGLLITHLGCQIRDIYRHMGEQPPEEYQMEGPGKLSILGDPATES